MVQSYKVRKNGELRGTPRVDVMGASGEKLGVMTLAAGLRLAVKHGLDLVEVNPKASPPICKLLDFDKQKYEAAKKVAQEKRESEDDDKLES
jgi:translation initiation factor IF-3